MSWNDRTFKGEEEGASYPFIQFMSNGNLMEPSQSHGKFAITEEQMLALANGAEKDAIPQKAEPLELVFRKDKGKQKRVPAYAMDGLVVVPVLTRFAWMKDGFRLPGYVEKSHGKLQLLCYVANGSSQFIGPLMLTVSGLASKDLKNALREHRTTVRKATQGKAPAYAFSMLLTVGATIMRGSQQQSRACPIVLDQDWETALVENPDNYYIGDDLADEIESRWEEFKAWADTWSKSGPNGDGEVVESADESPDAPQDTSAARTVPTWYNTKLPFKTAKYQDGTLGDIYAAGDSGSLQILVTWCQKQGYPEVAVLAGKALDALQNAPF